MQATVVWPAAEHKNFRSETGSRLLVGSILLICFCFCLICGWIIFDARRAAWNHASIVGATLVSAASADIARNIETLNLSLEGIIENLKLPDLDDIRPERRHLILFDRSATARHLSSILVVRKDGSVRFDSRTINPAPVSLRDRDYFQVHQHNESAGLFIGHPIKSRLTGAPVITFSRRLNNSDGSFAGVVLGGMRLHYFQELFRNISLGPNASVTLARNDGIVLIRYPQDSEFIERDSNPAKLIDQFSETPSGNFQSRATTDDRLRLFTYSQVGELPLLVAAGQTTEDIYVQWWPQAYATGALMAALAASTIALVVFLRRNLKLRTLAEAELAAMASTDGLTGLANRRSFDNVIETQWRIAKRETSDLALLMIDVDNFKAFNDTFGHPAGDNLLRVLAASIANSLQRPDDLGARFGGDEFAVLLPRTSLEGARILAQRIRHAFVTSCYEQDIRAQYSRLSIGLASYRPAEAQDCQALIGAADAALYRAKLLGRNRTESVLESVYKNELV
jgi:diguanylate cyclase (GGDEF)-like protein